MTATTRDGRLEDRLRRAIFAQCRQRGIGDDLRHELQESVTGKRSLTEMTVTEMQAVLDRISGKDVWTSLGMARKLLRGTERGEARLRAFAWSRFGKVPEKCDSRETRSLIAFARRIAGTPAPGGSGDRAPQGQG